MAELDQLQRFLNAPEVQRMPRSDAQWQEFIRVLVEGPMRYLSADGRLTTSEALPTMAVMSRGSVLVGSTSPVTATDAGSDATINIAQHTYQVGARQVTYNSGSVTGLAYSTTYWVFTRDRRQQGGTVTYEASTVPASGTSDDDYVFIGQITTPAAAAGDTSGGSGGGAGGTEDPGTGGIWP